ncbi:MAG: misacylated tRNA(Ala) deacylase [Candidatus Azotimanducaceae bacterium]
MTEKVFYQDSYQKTLATVVTAVSEDWVQFAATIFYPLGGGQPGDQGTVSIDGTTLNILDTLKGETADSITHQLETDEHQLKVGDDVVLELAWERRYKHMRMHTCMHLLGSLIPVPVTGGSVGAEKSRLDFDIGDNQLDKEDLTRRLNVLIQAGTDLTLESITDEELDDNPSLVRTMSVQPPRGAGTIRMVRIGEVDYQPCGGTHLKNTAEIGPIRVSKIENKGKRNRRVNLVFDV